MDANSTGPLGPNGVDPAGAVTRPVGVPVQIPPTSGTFRDLLAGATTAAPAVKGEPLKFSAHALARLESRNIQLSPADVARMNDMADKAAAKGSKQSLFVMKDTAMVVSIKNRVVITAVDKDSMKDNVFTNIDSAAIIN